MPTPDELRAEIAKARSARSAFRSALEGASANWERQPSAGDGEEAWSPRQAAEHTIGAEPWFTTQICESCGYPGLDPVEPSYATAADALKAFDEVSKNCDGRLKHVTNTDLAMKHERMETVAGVMQHNAMHLNEHAAQIQEVAR